MAQLRIEDYSLRRKIFKLHHGGGIGAPINVTRDRKHIFAAIASQLRLGFAETIQQWVYVNASSLHVVFEQCDTVRETMETARIEGSDEDIVLFRMNFLA